MLNLFQNEKSKENNKKLYLQINKIKLQDYIAKGMIAPDIYLGDEIERDIQSKNKTHLALASSYIESIDQSQLLLEIILTDDEKEELKQVGDIYYYEKPLPFTRIKQIYIQDKKTKDRLLTEISNYEIGYIPENLFVFFKKARKIVFEKGCEYSILESNEVIDYEKEIRKFDKLMGMFSFMKNTDLYYFDETQTFSNYSKNYIAVLSLFNNPMEKRDTNFLHLLKENRELFDLVNSDNQINDDFINAMIVSTDDEEIKEIYTTLLNDPNSKRRCLERLREKDGVHFYVCLLYIHKQKDSNKKDSFKANIAQEIPYEKAELALAFLGLYYGYKSLRANEEIQINDKYISKLIEKNRVNIKFKLDSKLDYITVESIYNRVFYDKKDFDFDYLEYPISKKIANLPTDKNFKTWYEMQKEDIMSAPYIKIRKKSFDEILSTRLAKYDEEIRFGKYYLVSFIKKYYEKIINYSKDGKPTEPYCKKEDFYSVIKEDESRREKELLSVFDIDKK